jgi:hypothetical protein
VAVRAPNSHISEASFPEMLAPYVAVAATLLIHSPIAVSVARAHCVRPGPMQGVARQLPGTLLPPPRRLKSPARHMARL